MPEPKRPDKPGPEDQYRKDEYGGKFKGPQDSVGENEKYGTEQSPKLDDQPPWKNLKTVGG